MTYAAVALGFGLVIGTAISPTADPILAGPVAQAPPVPQPPATAVVPSAPSSGGGSSGSAASGFHAVPGTASGTPPSVGTTTTPAAAKKPGKGKKKPSGQPLTGVVVHTNPNASSYVLSSRGSLIAIHAPSRPAPGTRLKLTARKLANGTYAESGKITKRGQATTTTFSGVVTASDPTSLVYTASGPGASLLIRVPAGGAVPVVGSRITVSVDIGPAQGAPAPSTPAASTCDPDGVAAGIPTPPLVPAASLTQRLVTVDSNVLSTELEGIVQASCPTELVVSADDTREWAQDLVLAVPSGIDSSRLTPGLSINAAVGISGSSLTLTGVSSDHGAAGANDPSTAQGSIAAPTGATLKP